MKKIYVGNLSTQASENDLLSLFSPYGTVTSVSFAPQMKPDQTSRIAFVEMNDEDAGVAIAALDGQKFDGKGLTVREADSKPPPPKPNNERRGYGNPGLGRLGRTR